jgi:far upstream element-binding protein
MFEQNRTSRGPLGSYNQQHGGGYRPPGPPQQYQQPPPQAYGQFSQQPGGGYSSGWEQRSPASAAQPQQQTSFDYYGQQGQQVMIRNFQNGDCPFRLLVSIVYA